jgi:hypothetical protein
MSANSKRDEIKMFLNAMCRAFQEKNMMMGEIQSLKKQVWVDSYVQCLKVSVGKTEY